PVLNGVSWNQALHDGYFESDAYVEAESSVTSDTAERSIASQSSGEAFELVLYTKTALGDGRQANNPWLQELPDPISRTTWDNYLTVSAADAKELGLENKNVANGALNGSYATIRSGNVELRNVPVLIQPGQAKGSVGLALGYGKIHNI